MKGLKKLLPVPQELLKRCINFKKIIKLNVSKHGKFKKVIYIRGRYIVVGLNFG